MRIFIELPRAREEVRILGRQLLRSGTSVGAHLREASRARSDAEFCSKLEGTLQELDETQLWIELLRDDCGIGAQGLEELHHEANELIAVLVTMVNRTKAKAENR